MRDSTTNPRAGDQISPHEVRVLKVFRAVPGRWMNNREVAATAGVARRTANSHTSNLTRIGVLMCSRELPGGNRYTLVTDPGEEARAYLERWARASQLCELSSAG